MVVIVIKNYKRILTYRFESLDLSLCGALSSGDDGSGVTHPPAGWRGDAGDEGHDRLGVGARVVGLQEVRGPLLGLAADLADHDDALGVGVLQEDVQAVHEVGAVERVAADAHAQRLAQADLMLWHQKNQNPSSNTSSQRSNLCRLVHSLIGERARPGDDADTALLVDVAGHDANLALE